MTERAEPTVLISSAGRRVELLRAFRTTLDTFSNADQHNPGRVLAVDSSWYSSAYHDADEAFIVPPCTDPDFIPRMVALCAMHDVDLLVPTIDPELPVYAAARDQFAAVGTMVAVSSPEVVAIAGDKTYTHSWLTSQGFPTVLQSSIADVRADLDAWRFPLVVKPRFGSASKGVAVVEGPGELDRRICDWPKMSGGAGDPQRDLVVQSLACGVEYTVDVLVTRDGMSRASKDSRITAVPRRRIEVRAGEASKAVTVRSPPLIELTEKLCTVLPGAYGPLNIQMFLDEESGQVSVIELNARFGGGYPLSFTAGADFPRALLQEARGLPVTASLDDWRDNLVMLRYDAAIFADGPGKPSRGAL
jgi:carbamoyl-phosphate synthase large subunit